MVVLSSSYNLPNQAAFQTSFNANTRLLKKVDSGENEFGMNVVLLLFNEGIKIELDNEKYYITDVIGIPVEDKDKAIEVSLLFEMLRQSCNKNIEKIPEPEKPTLQDTTNWLTDKLENTKPSFEIRIERLRFQACTMSYAYKFIGDGGFEIVSSYSVSLKFLNNVDRGKGNGFDHKVFLEFSKNFDEEKTTLRFKEKRDYELNKMSRIVIFTNDAEMGQRVKEAFFRLKELCAENIKEPF